MGLRAVEPYRGDVEAAVKDVRDSLTSDDAGEIRSKTEALQSAFQKVSQQIYEAAASEQQAAGGDGASPNGDSADSEEEVVDAEVVDDEPSNK